MAVADDGRMAELGQAEPCGRDIRSNVELVGPMTGKHRRPPRSHSECRARCTHEHRGSRRFT